MTTIESLGPRLAEHYSVIMASNKRNKIIRLFDMVFIAFKYRHKTKLILLDCYSSQAFWYVVVIALLAQWYRLPYIPILHGGDLQNRLKKSKTISRFVFGNAAKNISPSKYHYNFFKSAGYRVEYIPNFIDISNYKIKYRHALTPMLLWVRSFHTIYNPTLAIKILYALRQHYTNAHLCMVGPAKDGSLKECQKLSNEYGISDSVTFTGSLSKMQWVALSEQYDMFINTTNYDNMPVSVIEAMALGLPVISTNAGGLPFLIENGFDGMLVEKGDVQGFVSAIGTLMKDESYVNEMTLRARNKVEQFDWKIIEIQWKILIDKVMKL